ncbi:MAG: hypothetical protein ACREJC_05540 [Tepidisphaeraceae bacterium]
MLGLSSTYTAAQAIVAALAANDFDTLVVTLNEFTGDAREEVILKAVALGADPDLLRSYASTDEVIEVVGTAPKPKTKIPWLWIVLGIVGVGGAAYHIHKRKRLGLSGFEGRQFFQDGRDFYDEDSGKRIASYPALVEDDNDTEGAQAARRKFLRDHPEYA